MKWNEEVSPTFRRWFWILLAFVLVMLALAFCSTRSVSQTAVSLVITSDLWGRMVDVFRRLLRSST